jgi:hypothetical protein
MHLECSKPTAEELKQRCEFYQRMADLRALHSDSENSGSVATAEQMIRQDRLR